MFGAGNALVDVLAVSFVMLRVKVCPIRILSSSSTLWYNASDATDLCPVIKEKTSEIMPENPGSEFCNVLSYEKYVSKLNPNCEKLWQRPKDEFCDDDQVFGQFIYCFHCVL
jgi:hypothetical protein